MVAGRSSIDGVLFDQYVCVVRLVVMCCSLWVCVVFESCVRVVDSRVCVVRVVYVWHSSSVCVLFKSCMCDVR